jgi:hypothetical protein
MTRKYPGLTRREHVELGAELQDLRERALAAAISVGNVYPKSSFAYKRAHKALRALDSLRCALDSQSCRELPGNLWSPLIYRARQWTCTGYGRRSTTSSPTRKKRRSTVADRRFRVTVEDLTTGEQQTREVAPGDYVLVPFEPCHLASEQHHPNGTVVLNLCGRTPRVASNVTIEHRKTGADATHDRKPR